MSELAQYDAWQARLEVARSVEEVLAIKGIADGAAEFYAAQGDWHTAQLAKEVSIRSARKAGLILLPPEHGGKTPRKAGLRGDEATPYEQAIEDAGISRVAATNWQKLARIPDKRVDDYFMENPPDQDSEYTIAGVMGLWYQRSDIAEWETPQWLFDILNGEFRFTLDVCASEANAKCAGYFDKEVNALKQQWIGTCWMNPPYGREIKLWMHRAKRAAQDGATIVCLVPARPDTEWWWDNCIQHEIRFIKGRLKWPPDNTTAPFPSAVVVMMPKGRGKTVWWNPKQ